MRCVGFPYLKPYRGHKGQGLAEYAMLGAFVLLLGIGGMQVLGNAAGGQVRQMGTGPQGVVGNAGATAPGLSGATGSGISVLDPNFDPGVLDPEFDGGATVGGGGDPEDFDGTFP